MRIKDYQEISKRTLPQDIPRELLSNIGFGLIGETGEVIDELKKILWHSKEINKDKITNELGDVMWYISSLCSVLDISLEDVLQVNVDKLLKRYPNGFNAEDSKKRVDVNE